MITEKAKNSIFQILRNSYLIAKR